MRAQLSRLVGPGFVAAVGARRLPDVLRYLRAVERRLDRLGQDPRRDGELMERVHQLEDRLARTAPAGGEGGEGVERVRWMIEELRVSYFAQALGTAYTVSDKRILREIDRLHG